MRRIYWLLIILVLLMLLAAGLWFVLITGGGGSDPEPYSADLDCCQCEAVGEDQGDPFLRVAGKTCSEDCFEGCVERGYNSFFCKISNVSGYAIPCPDVMPPTVTPFGE